jgi:hypothetical protein
MLKPITAAALGLLMMGCHSMDKTLALADGTLRVEPHPVHADSVRVITLHKGHFYRDSLGRGNGTTEAHRATVIALWGDTCRDAPIIPEGTVQVTSFRQDIALRVICPAVR